MGWLKSVFCGVKWFLGIDEDQSNDSKLAPKASPFVDSKPSRMYYDEDGDLAEEFYEEVTPQQGTPWMRRVTKNLTKQGVVPLEIQRLHPDFPLVMCDVSS
ncbi:tumor suppressor candidate 2-like [Clytia hemisphaerica]|uniref:Uncharacterized protein n=1 Tax=Clytia hemisphaerica TaxID=252671 RepID=A0A7M5UHX6_9CNID|eukprot:TCONS_00001104-protein